MKYENTLFNDDWLVIYLHQTITSNYAEIQSYKKTLEPFLKKLILLLKILIKNFNYNKNYVARLIINKKNALYIK